MLNTHTDTKTTTDAINQGKHIKPKKALTTNFGNANFHLALTNVNIALCIVLLLMFAILAFTKPSALNNVTIITFIIAELLSCVLPTKI